jgi:hypothetical protein
MKRVKNIGVSFGLATLLFLQSGCFGSFQAVNGLYNWNKDVSDNKWIQELVFLGLNIIPVYGLFSFGDVVIFNLIEFWSGTNPLSMDEGQREIQDVTMKGERYRIDVTRDTYTTTQLTGKDKGDVRTMRFDRCDRTWKYSDADICDQPMLTYLDDRAENVRIYTAQGTVDMAAADLNNTDVLLAKLGACAGEDLTCLK